MVRPMAPSLVRLVSSLCFVLLLASVASSGNGPISDFISDYEGLNYAAESVGHRRVRRDLSSAQPSEPVTLRFRAMMRPFHLHLHPDPTIIDRDAVVEVSGVPHNVDHVTPVLGYLGGREANGSLVYGVLVNGLFRGSIRPGDSDPGEYHVESAVFYEEARKAGHHSIIYHDRHIDWEGGARRRAKRSARQNMFCGRADPHIAMQMEKVEQLGRARSFIDSARQRFRRSTEDNCGNLDGLTCSLRLQSDTFLWDHIMKNVDKNQETAITEITSLFYNHVSVAKQIYSNTQFKNGDFKVSGINFRVNRILINTTKDCEAPIRSQNPFCADNVDVINFLNLNAFMDHSKFCLAYVFTYRDFQRGTLGLAWVGDANNAGGICEWFREIPEGGVPVHKSLNTGVVTLLNYASPVSQRVSQSTFAHEMGHNFGATHDDDSTTDAQRCVPGASSKSGNYIMFSSATGGDKPNNLKFSTCSKVKIANQLNLVIKCKNNKRNCLVKADGAFCGNKLVENGSDGVAEQCDCGFEDNAECTDVCCNPATSKNKLGCTLKKTAKVGGSTVTVQCSPTAGECCDKGCQYKNNSTICDHGHDCRERSFCTGRNASCILTDPKPNYVTTCMNNTRTCFKGECTASICKHFNLEECFVSYKPDEKATKANEMCFVACRNDSNPTSPCISTYLLMRDETSRQTYPQLTNFLKTTKGMIDGIRMKPGAPCDNYRGYCDVFSRCRLIDADGPLTRLKNLIFSPRTLTVIREWIIQNWYYVMLMSLGVVLFMALFVKCCAVHTPSSNPNAPRARSLSETLRRGHRRRGEDGRSGRGARDERMEMDAIGFRPGTNEPHIDALRGGAPGDRALRYAEAPPPYDQATPGHGHGRGRRHQQHSQASAGPYTQGGKPQPKPRGKKKGGKAARA